MKHMFVYSLNSLTTESWTFNITYLLYGTTALEGIWRPFNEGTLSDSILITLIFY